MTDEQKAEYTELKAKADARRDRPGYKKNVDEIEARMKELENGG